MEDKELKKELDKIPDVDKNGDPIYKIDNTDLSEEETLEDIETPLFLEDNPETSRGNAQDIKDSTTED